MARGGRAGGSGTEGTVSVLGRIKKGGTTATGRPWLSKPEARTEGDISGPKTTGRTRGSRMAGTVLLLAWFLRGKILFSCRVSRAEEASSI